MFLLHPALPWLLAARCAAAYWAAVAEAWASFDQADKGDVVPFPATPAPRRSAIANSGQSANVVRFTPGNRR